MVASVGNPAYSASTMSLTKEDFSQLRLVIREEVRPIVRQEVRLVVREEVESILEEKLEPIRGEIQALRNDVKELFVIVGNLEKTFSHHRRIVHKAPR